MGRRRVLRSTSIVLAAPVMLLGVASAAQAAFVIDDRPLPPGTVGTDYANLVTATGGNGTPYRPAGQTTATFAVATVPVTSSWTAVITASLNGAGRFQFLSIDP